MSAVAQQNPNPDITLNLVKRAQQGDTDAFAALFHSHRSRVYSLCLRMTRNVAEAEDLTQEAFLQVFRKLPTFRGDSALSTWMYRVAVNTVLMYFRKRGRPQFSLDEEQQSADQSKSKKHDYGAYDMQLSGCVDRITLARAIKELPTGYRTIFLLHEVQGYEHREIARLLKCSVGNSKSQLHKARLRMRELLTASAETAGNGRMAAGDKPALPGPANHRPVQRQAIPWPSRRRNHPPIPVPLEDYVPLESVA